MTANTELPQELLELPVKAGETYTLEGALIFDQLVSERKRETPAQRRRREKKAKHDAAVLLRGLNEGTNP